GGLLFLPYLNGERSPVFDTRARGLFFGIGLNTRRAELTRAVMEGVGYGLGQLMDIIEGVTGTRLDPLPVSGGGGKGRLWMQILSDILGRTLTVSNLRDAGSVGAAMLGGIAGGLISRDFKPFVPGEPLTFHPSPETAEPYADAARRYRELYPAVKHLYE
ncbi:MAG: hypothetical protein LBR29_10620, partial [Methylobacteriaceae bacterium]|nr:hypothetical protein [Methylobacteriaceae bacterium]